MRRREVRLPVGRWQTTAHADPQSTVRGLVTLPQGATQADASLQRLARIRNIGIVAHVDAGKTTTTERALFYAGLSRCMGDVDRGDTIMDYLKEERERGITINAAATTFQWARHGNSSVEPTVINLIDTPGHVDFNFEVERSLRVMDGAVMILDAVEGVQAQTLAVWRQAAQYRLPTVAFINKCDREGADIDHCLASMRELLRCTPVLVNTWAPMPPGEYAVLDVLHGGALLRFGGAHGERVERQLLEAATAAPDTAHWHAETRRLRDRLIEAVAEHDDGVCAEYLEGQPIGPERLHRALRRATQAGHVVPVLCGSALRNAGVQPLLDAVVDYLPSPLERPDIIGVDRDAVPRRRRALPQEPLAAYVFKVQHDVHRGPLAFIRVFCGGKTQPLSANTRVRALSRDASGALSSTDDRVDSIFRVHADDLIPVEQATCGGIYAVSGLKHARTGDTVAVAAAAKSTDLWLPGLSAPSPVFGAALELDDGTSATAVATLNQALDTLVRDDPSLAHGTDDRTGELVLRGMGELHLDIARARLEGDYGIRGLHMGAPRVAFCETILGDASVAPDALAAAPVHRLSRKMGNTWWDAAVQVLVRPLSSQAGEVAGVVQNNRLQLREELLPGGELGSTLQRKASRASHSLPPAVQAVERGARSALQRGPRMGYPLIGVEATVCKILTPEAAPAALSACAAEAVQDALARATPRLAEPIMRVYVRLSTAARSARSSTSAHSYLGTVARDLSSSRRRGQVLRVDNDRATVEALVPLEGLIGYATAVRSLTAGHASVEMHFEKYDVMDEHEAKRVAAGIL